jgi:hypothetical protein
MMKKLCALLLTILGLTIYPFVVDAARVQEIDIIEYGIFEATTESKKSGYSLNAPTNILGNLKCIRKTSFIPAILGTRFGLRFLVKGTPKREKIEVLFKVQYPGLKHPGTGQTIHNDEAYRQIEMGESNYVGHTFDREWTMVPGKWSFQIFYRGRKLAEKNFTVYEPE